MGNDNYLDWLILPKEPGDKLDALKIKNGKSWIENAKAIRDQEWEEMLARMKQINLWNGEEPGHVESVGQKQPSIYVYPEQQNGAPRGAIIISAGGGFIYKSHWEAQYVAERFYDAGLSTFILNYRVRPYEIKHSLADLSRAIRFLRANAERFNIRSDKIAVTGFSAGGVLSTFASTLYDNGNQNDNDPIERVSSRPDAAIIGYGTVSYTKRLEEFASPFRYAEQQRKSKDSPDLTIHAGCPPFFIWQTIADDPRYSCSFVSALTEVGVPSELHIFPEGAHGIGLADGGHKYAPYYRSTSRWSQMAIEFLENLGFGKLKI